MNMDPHRETVGLDGPFRTLYIHTPLIENATKDKMCTVINQPFDTRQYLWALFQPSLWPLQMSRGWMSSSVQTSSRSVARVLGSQNFRPFLSPYIWLWSLSCIRLEASLNRMELWEKTRLMKYLVSQEWLHCAWLQTGFEQSPGWHSPYNTRWQLYWRIPGFATPDLGLGTNWAHLRHLLGSWS